MGDTYLKDKQHYIDRYDLHTIEEILDYYKAVKKGFEENRKDEEFKHYTKKQFDFEVRKVMNLFFYSFKGERYRKKAETIQKWMDADRQLQGKYDNAVPPSGIICQDCKVPTKVANKDLLHLYDANSQVLFMFRCVKCNKGQAFYEDGTEWKYEPPKCPDCNADLDSDMESKDDVMTTTWKCTKCPYKKVNIEDFKKFRKEQAEKEAKEKDLLARYRDELCLNEKEGQEYIEASEAMEVGNEIYKEEVQKYGDSAYITTSRLKKLTIVELEKLLTTMLEKAKYIKLTFGNPDMDKEVIVPFTVQDADQKRTENFSTSDLKKLLKDTLEETNWRLMSDGINYRLGIMSGRLKGYEGEEALLSLAGKENKQLVSKIDNEKRTKYINHRLVQLARLSGEVQGQENVRKKRLEKEPMGFAIPAGEVYSCHICHTTIRSDNGWYDKYGFKCSDCQRAVDNGILLPEVFEKDRSWYSKWHIENEYHIPELTIKKLIQQGALKPKIVTNSAGKPHTYVFMALENNDYLEDYKEKHKMIFLCGIPASGKSELGKYLHEKHDYSYVPMEDDIWPDEKMHDLWNDIFTSKRQYQRIEKFIQYLHENYGKVVLDWGFPIAHLEVLRMLKSHGFQITWLSCSTAVARERFIKRGKGSVTYFDNQIKSIQENVEKIEKELKPSVIDVLKNDKRSKTIKEIYSELSSIIS